ncbi:hypothetical protein CCP2SC5_110028 [Azospirillaceae bacterium]
MTAGDVGNIDILSGQALRTTFHTFEIQEKPNHADEMNYWLMRLNGPRGRSLRE